MPRHAFSRPLGTLVEIEIESTALADNLLGDPSTRSVAVYLPPRYEHTTDRYPLFVDLVGFMGSGFSHVGWSPFSESVPQRVDRLVTEGRMGPAVFAFPDCFTSLGGNQYINSSAMGRWEDFLIDEMLPRLESEFRLLPGREHRAVFGKSSGGYGAIAHGLRRADVWGAVACHSGDMAFDLCYRVEIPKAATALAKAGGIESFLNAYAEAPKAKRSDTETLMLLAMAATYDPDPSAYKGIRLPVDPVTCELDEERWAAWATHDPVEMVRNAGYRENLGSLRGLYVDCGDHDQFHLAYGARRFVAELERHGIAHRYEEFDDDHSDIDYRMDESLPYLYAALAGD